jgi:trk system potassium uptake protein TrkA
MQRFAVIGIGQFGARVAQRLSELGGEVLAVDADEAVVASIRSRVSQAIQVDATDEDAFRACGVDEVDTVIVAVGRDIEVSILVVAQLVRLAVPHIVARASSTLHETILRNIGAHEVTNPEEEMGDSVALSLVAPEIRGRVLLPTGHEFVQIDAPEFVWGKAVGQLDFHGAILIAVKRHEPALTRDGQSEYKAQQVDSPAGDFIIEQGDTLALVGDSDDLRSFRRMGA